MPQQLTITGELPDLNTEINKAKAHWATYAKHKKTWTNTVAYEAKASLKPVQSYPVHIAIDWHTKNLRKDPDNIAFAIKYLLDGLVTGGILENDSQKHIASIEHTFTLKRNKPRVNISIYEPHE